MFQRAFLGLVLIAATFFLIRGVVLRFVSDETRLRWIVEEMVAGYNDASLGPCVGPIADDWRHGSSTTLDREVLKGGLLRQFWNERDHRTKAFLYRVEVPEDTLSIEVREGEATLDLEARFERLRGATWEPLWHIRIEAELDQLDGDWKIRRSSHEDLEGRGFRG